MVTPLVAPIDVNRFDKSIHHQNKNDHINININTIPYDNKNHIKKSSPILDLQQVEPVYHSQLYVHKDSPFLSLHHLQNATFAFNDETSLSGYHALRIYLREYFLLCNSLPPNELKNIAKISIPFFQKSIRTGAHAKSVELVVNRGADVLCLDENVRQSLNESENGKHLLSQLRGILVPSLINDIQYFSNDSVTDMRTLHGGIKCIPHTFLRGSSILSTPEGLLGPNPLQPVLVSNRIPVSLQQRIKNAFLEVGLRSAESRYIVVDQDDYEFIRYMLHERENECGALPHVLGPQAEPSCDD